MGGLPPLIAIAIAGCDTSSAQPPTRRSDGVVAGDAAPSKEAPSGHPAASASASAAPRKLCEIELGRVPRRFPKGTFTPVAAPNAQLPADKSLTPRAGRWTWINFFAAYCGPCKEEMPRLRQLKERLASSLDVVFVSLDDDERQLTKFLADQPESGVRSALWLEPKSRGSWLNALEMKESPDLPSHILIDRKGKVRCIFDGAIADSDFATVASIVRE